MNCCSRFLVCSALLFASAPTLLLSQSVAATSVSYNSSIDTENTQVAPEIVEMQKVSNLWDEAVNQRDQYALELVLSPKLVDISSNGQVTNRDQQVATVVQKNSPVLSLTQKVASVRMMGNVAVVNGTYDIKFHPGAEHRQEKDEKGVYSQVFERMRNSWVCINSQRTTLVVQAVSASDKKKEAANQKGLSNGLPFSLPGFHHKDSDQ